MLTVTSDIFTSSPKCLTVLRFSVKDGIETYTIISGMGPFPIPDEMDEFQIKELIGFLMRALESKKEYCEHNWMEVGNERVCGIQVCLKCKTFK